MKIVVRFSTPVKVFATVMVGTLLALMIAAPAAADSVR